MGRRRRYHKGDEIISMPLAGATQCGGVGTIAVQGFIGGLSSSIGFIIIILTLQFVFKKYYEYKNKDK